MQTGNLSKINVLYFGICISPNYGLFRNYFNIKFANFFKIITQEKKSQKLFLY